MSTCEGEKLKMLLLMVVVEYLFLLSLVFVVSGRVIADSFYPSLDIALSNFHVAFAIGRSGVAGPGISSTEILLGEDCGSLENLDFFDVAQYAMGVYHRSSQPGTTLDVLPGMSVRGYLLPYNQAGHVVNILNSWLFLGKYQTQTVEDVLMVEKPVQYRNIAYYNGGILYTKGGRSVEIGPLGNYFVLATPMLPSPSRSFNFGVVKSPITVEVVSSTCREGLVEGGVKVKNSGALAERVQLFGQPETLLTSGEEKVLPFLLTRDQVANDNFLLVKNVVERCMSQKSSGDIVNSDDFALIFSRDDKDSLTYTFGSMMDLPGKGDGDSYCIRRVPYRIEIPLVPCANPSRYQVISEGSKEFVVKPGGNSKHSFVIKNIGGDAELPAGYEVSVPMRLSQYTTFTQVPSVETTVNQERVFTFYTRNTLRAGEEEDITVQINLPNYISSELAASGEVSVRLVGTQEYILMKYEVETIEKFSFLGGEIACKLGDDSRTLEISVNLRVEGNVSPIEYVLPLEIAGENIDHSAIKFYAVGGESIASSFDKGTFQVFAAGPFLLGDNQLRFTAAIPGSGGLHVALADMRKTACEVQKAPEEAAANEEGSQGNGPIFNNEPGHSAASHIPSVTPYISQLQGNRSVVLGEKATNTNDMVLDTAKGNRTYYVIVFLIAAMVGSILVFFVSLLRKRVLR